MIRRISRSALILFMWIVIQINPCAAHEGRPVYIKLTRITENQYALQWKIPPVMPQGQAPFITLEGAGCTVRAGRILRSLSGRRHYLCTRGANNLNVRVEYSAGNPALSSLLVFERMNGLQSQRFFSPDQFSLPVITQHSVVSVAYSYVIAGARHILIGYDHLLFILCLLFISGSVRRTLITVTGFTIAHSITLGLAGMNVISVPVPFMEALIALSILVLGAEIARNKKDTLSYRYPAVVACCFGLLHGFGFASVLGHIGLPIDQKLAALAFFNIGVEMGQLAFIAACLLLIQLTKPVLHTGSVKLARVIIIIIGTLSAYWFIERSINLL